MSSVRNTTGLVADIGGTNARFALADATHAAIRQPQDFSVKDYADVFAAAQDYLSQSGTKPAPGSAVFAVAGPVSEGRIHFTNSGWHISEAEMREKLHVASARLINDFESVARAVPILRPEDLMTVGPALPFDSAGEGTFFVLGPGTGLGAAALLRAGGRSFPLAGEGGHVGFAPADDTEIEILKILRRRYDHVSVERLLSGAGLVNLHDALAEIEGRAAGTPKPDEITHEAKNNPASLSARAFGRFCAILGSVAGDFALVAGAKQGVLLAGGILLHAPELLLASEFRVRFEAKGRFRAYLGKIPTRLILDPHAGLRGAAALLADQAITGAHHA